MNIDCPLTDYFFPERNFIALRLFLDAGLFTLKQSR